MKNEKYEESIKILKELFNQENTERGIIKGVVSLGKKIEEKIKNNKNEVDNNI